MHEPAELKSLVYDNTSGAREIAERALQLLQRAASTSAAVSPGVLLDDLADAAVKILRSKPEMGQVFQALNRFLLDAEAEEFRAAEVGAFRIHVLSLAQAQLARLREDLNRVARHAQTLLTNGTVVLTHSRSSTVLETLRQARRDGKVFDVIVTESRPMLEGRNLARELAEEQIPVRFVVDALLATAVQGCDRVLIGADAVTPTGIVNKAGSRLVALAAREAGVRVAVLAESAKAWPKKTDPNLGLLHGRLRDPKEVWDHAPLGIEVVNLYFDFTPSSLVDSIVSEDGLLAPAEFWNRMRERGFARRFRSAFRDELVE